MQCDKCREEVREVWIQGRPHLVNGPFEAIKADQKPYAPGRLTGKVVSIFLLHEPQCIPRCQVGEYDDEKDETVQCFYPVEHEGLHSFEAILNPDGSRSPEKQYGEQTEPAQA